MNKNSTGSLVLTLTVIGIISALALAFVFQWTTPYIKQHEAKNQEEAVFAVLPGAVEYKEVVKNNITFYEGYDNTGSRVGVATIINGGGFQGMIKMMIGSDPAAGKLYGIRILDHQETPGLGAKIRGEKYKGNFTDKPFGDYNVVKRPAATPYEVEAIAGATISSEKVTTIVENAIKMIESNYGGGA